MITNCLHTSYRVATTLLTLLLLVGCFTAEAQNNYALGGLAGAGTRMGFGARGMAMANALGAVTNADGLSYYNPAAVPFQSHPTAASFAAFLPLDRSLSGLSYTQSIRPSGGFSLAILHAGVSDLQGRDVDGLPTETYSTSENMFLFTFGTMMGDNFSIGVSAKILYYSLFAGVKSTTVGFDFGALYRPDEQWSVGLILGDVNSKYKWDTSQLYGSDGNTTIERFPIRRRFAIAYTPLNPGGLIAGELEWVDHILLARIGAEFPLHENFTIRAGIDQIDFGRKIDAKPGVGFSLMFPVGSWRPALQYGYVFEPYSTGGIHVLSLAVRFE